ncbi:MAG: AzlC family ABC transporter permease [Bacillota bacterium]
MKQMMLKAAPLALTILALGVIFGAGGNIAGISNLGAVLMTLLVYSGASQFAALNLWFLGSASVLLSTAFLSSRFILMSATLSIDMADLPWYKKAILAFGIIDESYGLYTVDKDNNNIMTFGLYALVFYIAWLLGTIIGLMWGSFMPAVAQSYLEHVFPMVFLVLTVSTIDSKDKGYVAFWAISLFIIANKLLSSGWPVLVAAITFAFRFLPLLFIKSPQDLPIWVKKWFEYSPPLQF